MLFSINCQLYELSWFLGWQQHIEYFEDDSLFWNFCHYPLILSHRICFTRIFSLSLIFFELKPEICKAFLSTPDRDRPCPRTDWMNLRLRAVGISSEATIFSEYHRKLDRSKILQEEGILWVCHRPRFPRNIRSSFWICSLFLRYLDYDTRVPSFSNWSKISSVSSLHLSLSN